MNTYPKYKPIDIRWIDEIPDHWDYYKLKYTVDNKKYYQIGDGDHGSIKPDMYLSEGGIPYIRVQNLRWNGELIWDGMVYISNEVHNANPKSKILPNDILIAKTGATVGKLALIPESITEANTTSSVGKVSVDQDKFYPRFVLYAFMSKYFQDQIWIEASQKSAQPGFNIDDLIFFILISPVDIAEQTAIANFLDEKTAKIDELIEKKKQLIELLKEERTAIINQAVTKGIDSNVKLKPSGIDWLGDIPEHWEVKKLKYLCSLLKDGTHLPPPRVENGIPLLSVRNLVNGKDIVFLDDDSQISGSDFQALDNVFQVQKNDILLAIVGATMGKVSLVPQMSRFTIQRSLAIFRTKSEIMYYKFMFYFFQSTHFQNLLWNNTGFSAQPGIYLGSLANFSAPCPSVEEQEKVIDFIEDKLNKSENTISRIEKEIELLQEYRTALISEVVTGKIKVV